MKILIVDDQASNRIILKFFLESEGHECIEAEDGLIAQFKFRDCAPDCVLMDIVMPNMDGYEATKQIKEQSRGYHVPVIFLTAKTDEASILKCLEMGGDDYLPKPVNQVMLMAKIKAHSRTQELTQEIQSKNKELTLLHATLQQEHEMGQHVFNHTLSRSWQDCPSVKSYLSSMSTFNGDIFLVARRPNGGCYAMLGDFTGHGLAAAIGAIPVSQVFYAMCAKGMAIMDIAESMNSALKSFLPEYMFCAATLLDMDESGKTIKVWAGGLPNAPIIRPGEGVVSFIESSHMPMGILDPEDFNNEVSVIQVEEGDKMLLLTDGILEGMNAQEEMFGEERLVTSIGKGDSGYFENLLQAYDDFMGGGDQQDDRSLVELTAAAIAPEEVDNEDQSQSWMPWSSSVRLDAKQLKSIADPVMQIMQLFPRSIQFSRHIDIIRTIFSELFSNALEHGLLGLESDMKADADGFMQYYAIRTERLAQLEDGSIEISVEYDPNKKDQELRILVEDSGDGYQTKHKNLEENTSEWGRGLALIESLCHSVHYSRNGASVELFFTIS